MSLPVVISLLLVAQVAAADRAITVEVSDAPFDAGQLTSAIRVRTPVEGAPVRLRVFGIDRGRAVRIESSRGAREVTLGDARGAAAARLVALVASDLWLDDMAPAPEGGPAALRPHSPTLRLGALGGASGWPGTLGSVAIDLAVPRDGWLIACEIAGSELLDSSIDLQGALVRLGAGLRTEWIELRGGLVAMPIFVTTGKGDQTVLLGGGASARVVAPLGDRVRGLAAAGIDVFATTTEYRVGGVGQLTTPRWAPWFAAGIGVDL